MFTSRTPHGGRSWYYPEGQGVLPRHHSLSKFFHDIFNACRSSPISFQVEDTLFRLPRCMFEEQSEIFRDMFQLPHPDGASCDGSSEEQPLFLHGVRKAPFRRLLMAMDQRECPLGDDDDLDSETARTLFQEWLSVFELSCMWRMAKVRKRADEEISKVSHQVSEKDLICLLTLLDKLGILEIRDRYIKNLSRDLEPVKLIRIGIELPVYSFLLNGYARLVMQKSGILIEHEELLGMKTTSKLFRVRDEYLQGLDSNSHLDYYHHQDFRLRVMHELEKMEELKEALWR